MFKANVDRCKHVVEATTYLEIFSYSVGTQMIEHKRGKLMGAYYRIRASIPSKNIR